MAGHDAEVAARSFGGLVPGRTLRLALALALALGLTMGVRRR